MIRIVRFVLLPMLVGAIALGSAWAGTGLAPAPRTPDDLVAEALANRGARAQSNHTPVEPPGQDKKKPPPDDDDDDDLEWNGLFAGAGKVSIYPNPDEEAGDVWERDPARCETMSNPSEAFGHLGDLSSPWPRNSNCIYVGGFGLGPTNATKDFNTDLGLWARSAALSDGTETLVLTVIDGVYWFGEYGTMCDGCGWFDLQEELGDELGVDPSGFIFAATHGHAAPDFIGGWGGVPRWYMEQVADAIRDSVRQAVNGMRPAVLEYGEVLARQHNNERRNTYRSAEEAGLSWFRTRDVETRETVATVGAYAAHPTTVGMGSWQNVAHPDWPGVFNVRLEERFGGVGLHFMTGLGNMSARGGTQMGQRLADMVPLPGDGTALSGNKVLTGQVFWDQPVTNSVLLALGGGGFFDRPFSGPAHVSDGKSSQRPCVSASPVSVHTSISAARVGELILTAAPGEIFGNYSNAVKERNPDTVTFPLGMANDAMGYIMQSFETFDEGRQGLGFGGTDLTEYEDAYSIDRCFGDVALETTLRLLSELQ